MRGTTATVDPYPVHPCASAPLTETGQEPSRRFSISLLVLVLVVDIWASALAVSACMRASHCKTRMQLSTLRVHVIYFIFYFIISIYVFVYRPRVVGVRQLGLAHCVT